ncbi:MAG TPA: COX15/CtaA family protein [Saprospiraceae bacterium]|nr:COX15/CtaA family protein [Saprospiraceae bacterium]
METERSRSNKWLVIWLAVGLCMVFVQILVGGVTRLTGSGLSITRWDIVTGTIPPLNDIAWEEAFNLYKQTPQYQKINQGMDMSEFKFIFFWEYIHRLWARTMGFVFLIPFLFFLLKRSIKKETLRNLGVVVSLAAAAALFGWIMVASGLVNRPWVNAYKLTVHLGLGISLFIYLFYTFLKERGFTIELIPNIWRRVMTTLFILAIIQVCFGGMVSGMKAALNYPTWPMMNSEWIPEVLLDNTHWNIDSFLLYDKGGFMAAFVQLVHRSIGYLLFISVMWFAIQWIRSRPKETHWVPYCLVGIIVVQVLLGIMVLLGSKGSIPVLYGVLHQGVGILFLTYLFYIRLKFKSQ